MKDKLTVIDFFCGAGGFSEGFRQKGFQIIRGYDNWQPAIDTYNHNFGTSSTIKNILDFRNSTEEIELLPNTDVIIGSPPCVSFSSSNKSGKADKSLGLDLIKCFLRIVAIKKHQKNSTLKGWFMENVVNSKKFISQIYTFDDLNLTEWAKSNKINPKNVALNLLDNTTIINSADYGSYQARKRAISGEIIKVNRFIVPPPTNSNKEESSLPEWNTLGGLMNSFPAPNSPKSEKIISDPVYKSLRIKQIELTDHFYDSGLYKSEWRQSKELKTNHYCMGKMSFPENLDKPSRTITATKSGTSREALVYKSEYNRMGNGEYRSPTIREAASLMGFPFTYQFLGAINAKWRLVGNAVCPSVSRALAIELVSQLGIDSTIDIELTRTSNLDGIQNLNNYSEKKFDKQPKRTKKSRFRRHPIKAGNLTVTLSNYDIQKNNKPEGVWFTSIQYGTGINFKNQEVKDGFYMGIESILIERINGKKFIEIINNGFSEKIADSNRLQRMYEEQQSEEGFLEPTELIHELAKLIEEMNVSKEEFIQSRNEVFIHKKIIPVSQLFALYAVNRISSIANEKLIL